MAKIGRNDPCPCGSGKKYKHCCYDKSFVQTRPAERYATDPEWLKIRGTEGEMIHKILEFVLSRYGKDPFNEALEEFGLWGEYEVDQIHRESIFIPWFAFSFVPDNETDESEEEEQEEYAAMGVPFGLEFVAENPGEVDRYQMAFIIEACNQPYTFFVVDAVSEGKSLGLRDIFLGRTFTVKESAASKTLKRGDIVFSRVVELEGQAIMLGMAPTLFPPRYHREILNVRDGFKAELREEGRKLDKAVLREYDAYMRGLYFEIVDEVSNPPKLELRNTDGEVLKFVTLHFKLHCTPQEALDNLKSLSLPEFQDDILSDAVFDSDGNLLEVNLGWQKRGNKQQKEWSNTILGNLKIKGDVLTAEVNSEQRAERIKSEIEKRLKKRATFLKAVSQSIEDKMKERENQPESEESRREREEFQSRPEVQELVRKQIAAHWEAWYNERIPALDNKTPIQAARTKSGRERLEALFLEYEQNNERATDPNLRVDLAAMRKRLGL